MSADKPRYYLHGDQKEDDPDLWFCSSCDAFVPEVHFAGGHHKKQNLSDYESYLAEKKRLPTYMKNRLCCTNRLTVKVPLSPDRLIPQLQ